MPRDEFRSEENTKKKKPFESDMWIKGGSLQKLKIESFVRNLNRAPKVLHPKSLMHHRQTA